MSRMRANQADTWQDDPLSARDREAAAAAIDAAGTAEELWRAKELPRQLPRQPLPITGPVLVVAAHPDDEILGFGGTMAHLLGAGVHVNTVCLTDGEASHGDTTLQAQTRLAARRRDELARALEALGPMPPPVHIALPDTGLDEQEHIASAAIKALLQDTGAALCVAPWAGDLHSDHEAAGRAAKRAAQGAGLPLWSYPVWMWHWARPGDPRVPWHQAAVLPLTAEAQERKKAALNCFTSQLQPRGPQTGPVLPEQEIAHHTRALETVIT
ncbi:PIG-L deacetylase family protein [Streptomyces sp. NPDC046716]|uniref:PIG-L deacetylase family protein n=1 Tax=Streptomyces sp. NPDC046716 TaxID=3157093 RepID=UPI0033E536AA